MFPSLRTLSEASIGELHLTLEGLDGYYTSIPLSIAMDKKADCLLATHMSLVPIVTSLCNQLDR